MATWNSRGLRGSSLEELINYTNEYYREKKLAVVQKIPTPIKPIRWIKTAARSHWRILKKIYGRLHRCRTGHSDMLRCEGMCG